jgi:myo-inositol 2-dehydrogenase/D-chiro-inositol 1-dehydrogenase
MRRNGQKEIGLAVIGAGRIGKFRAALAATHPQVGWLGLAEIVKPRGEQVSQEVAADFLTDDFRELIARPEVNAVIVATNEDSHVEPILAAVERGVPVLIEKPLATDLADSARVLAAIEKAKVDAVIGYSQRFRRRWLTAKDRVAAGALGEVTMLTSRSLMNRMIALSKLENAANPRDITPMTIAGTHSLDLAMWMLEGKTPVSVYSRSIDKVLGPLHGGVDATTGLIEMNDGCIYNLAISWALPITWPGAVDSLTIGIVGTEGVLTVDDSHSDVIMAVSKPRSEGYVPNNTRYVDFLGGYIAGDVALGELWGPLRDETFAWLNRISLGQRTHHATAAEAHNRLMLTKAIDLSARLRREVELPISPDQLR